MDKGLKEKVLKKIKPDEKERSKREEIVELFLSELSKAKDAKKYDCDFFIGGSFGKDTYLKGSSDVDVFVRFAKTYDDSKLSVMLERMLDVSKFKFRKLKGSRDYFCIDFKERGFELKIEVVPNKRIDKIFEVVNSTDVSPLHVEFLRGKIEENPKIRDEIRLAKQYFKAKKLYGAESYIGGFSGHVIDILIAYYGSLKNLIYDAKNWGERTVIDINKLFKSEREALDNIDSSKHSNLIVVDPIIKERNAARALFEENYFRFLVIANNFDEFRESDFEVVKFNLHKAIKGAKKFAKVNGLSAYFYVFKIELGEISEDIAGSKLLRLNKRLEKYFEGFDFTVFKNDFFIDLSQGVCLFSLMFENTKISGLKKVVGPFVYMKDALSKFIKDKEYYFVEGNRLYSYEKRLFTRVDEVNKFKVDDFESMLGKDLDFVKKVKIFKY